MGQPDRFADLVDYLVYKPEGATAAQLAQHLGIARESVYRLLNKAPQRGTVIEKDGSIYRLSNPDRGQRRQQVLLSSSEIRLLTQALAPHMSRSPSLRKVLDKLKAAQDEAVQRHFHARSFLYVAHQDDWEDGLLDH